MSGRLLCRDAVTLLACALLGTFGMLDRPAPVMAMSEGQSFDVTGFTMQTTAATNIVGYRFEGIHNGITESTISAIENVPYTYTQAGGHPWALTAAIAFAKETITTPQGEVGSGPTRDVKDVVTYLPPGLLGDPMAVPRCPLAVVIASQNDVHCPSDTQVGVYAYWKNGDETISPIVNVVPEAGQSAEFALENTEPVDTPLLTGHLVRTGAGYGFDVVVKNIPLANIEEAQLTFWGVPSDPSHDPLRGMFCFGKEPRFSCQGGGERYGASSLAPFLTMGTDCAAGPQSARLRADSWEEPGRYVEKQVEQPLPTVLAPAPQSGLTGCDLLQFAPSLEVQPDTLMADEPVGVGVNVDVPLNETPGGVATPQLRDTTLTLPEGVSVSPSIVDGVQACEATGPEGINIPEAGVENPYTEETAADGERQLAPGHCPDASTVGTAEAVTPFLPEPVRGHVYLARPGCGGTGQHACTEQDAVDGNLYRLYLELGGTGALAKTGVHFKVALQTTADPATGQLTTRALGTPQAPFGELRIRLNSGPRAPLDNPPACGRAVSSADFTPWSAPGGYEGLSTPGTRDAAPSTYYDVEGCGVPTPFRPGFLAGTVSPLAGRFSSFVLDLTRDDREQFVKGIQVHTPTGLLALLAGVPLCGEAQADAGACPETSRIGTTRVASGAGSHPFEIGGNVYLTGPYCGPARPDVLSPPAGHDNCAPFGLSIVTHAQAGPFNLGLVVVRARIDIDPNDSTAIVTTDETGPYAIPQIVFGVPLRLKRVTVNIDRPGFMFNPTNCALKQIVASVSGNQNTVATVSSSFAASDCANLRFKPTFAVSTNGRTSRARGASLDVKLSYPKDALGNDSNIARVKVDLPKQLPSRLTTLQKACTAATFAANPANCPKESIVGVVRAHTPLLPVELTGPVYFVSHGGESFPSLVIVLQGDGVRVDLTGTTFINKANITSSTFKSVPDVPVNTFELFLPQGRYSALAANGSLCRSASRLVMPTEFVGQNGIVLRQRTRIAVTGCAKKRTKRARHARARHAIYARSGK